MPSYSTEIEDAVLEWIQGVTGESMADAKGKENFHKKFKDGVILCKLLNKIQPGIIKTFHATPKMPFTQRENIGFVNEALRSYGVQSDYLFVTADLYDKKNLGQVLIGLRALGTKASKNGIKPEIKI